MRRNQIKTLDPSKRCNRYVIVIVNLTLFALSCISQFEPHYKGEDNLVVVDGSVIKGLVKQVIKISRSSSISHPEYLTRRKLPGQSHG